MNKLRLTKEKNTLEKYLEFLIQFLKLFPKSSKKREVIKTHTIKL